MYKTLNHILILLLISTIFSQQQYWNIREEIISRYDNGNKKLLVKYSGQGSSETIVERITYTDNDQIVSIEKPLENTVIYFQYYKGKKIMEFYYVNGMEDKDKHVFYNDNEEIDINIYVEMWDHGYIRKIKKYNLGEEGYDERNFDEDGDMVSHLTNGQMTWYTDNGEVLLKNIYPTDKEHGFITYYEFQPYKNPYEIETYYKWVEIEYLNTDVERHPWGGIREGNQNHIKEIYYLVNGNINEIHTHNENGYTITYYENGKIKEEINKEYEGNDDDWDDEW